MVGQDQLKNDVFTIGNSARRLPIEPPTTATSQDKAIFELECAEIFLEQKHFQLAFEHGKRALAQKKLDLSLKLQIKDLVGICVRHLQSDREVFLFLQKSIKYLNRFPSEDFAFSIYINYLQALVSLGLKKEAKDQFETLPKYLKKIKEDLPWIKRYAQVKKLKYLFAKNNDDNLEAARIAESLLEISRFINDNELENFCEKELKNYKIEESQVFEFQTWQYLRQEKIALFPKLGKVARIANNDNMIKIIDLLIPSSLPTSEFFKRITNKTYDVESHEKFLNQILSKVEKTLAPGCINHEQDKVYLL